MNNLSRDFSNRDDLVVTGPKRGGQGPVQYERKAQNAAAGNLHDGYCCNILSFGSKKVALKKKEGL